MAAEQEIPTMIKHAFSDREGGYVGRSGFFARKDVICESLSPATRLNFLQFFYFF